MSDDFSDLDPVERMAVAHARSDVKAPWAMLLKLDAKLAAIALSASEPLIAQMKLVWWRDAILTSTGSRPKGEPMLAELSVYEREGAFSNLAQALAGLIDAWDLLLAHEAWPEAVLREFSRRRGDVIFGTYLTWTGHGGGDASAGERWAWNDLAARSGETFPAPVRNGQKMPRPLSILAMAAEQRRSPALFSGLRLVWHGLTGL